MDLEEPAITVDGRRVVSRLVGFDGLPQIGVCARIRPRLGPGCADNAQAHKEEAKHHFPRLHLTPAHTKKGRPEGRPFFIHW
jgi:hypothetical protein